MSPGTGNGQPSSSTPSTSMTGSAAQEPLSRREAEHHAREGGSDEPLLGVWVVQPAHLERHEPLRAEVDGLPEGSLLEVPEVDPLPVAAGLDVGQVEALLVGVWLAELGGDEDVLARGWYQKS